MPNALGARGGPIHRNAQSFEALLFATPPRERIKVTINDPRQSPPPINDPQQSSPQRPYGDDKVTTNNSRQRPQQRPIVEDKSNAPFVAGAIVVALLLGGGFWFMNHRAGPTAANPPAVTTAPAPAANSPAPRPEETTGQTAPRVQ